MVSNQAVLDGVFHALSDPTRRAMLRTLAGGERKIGDLAAPFRMSFPAASKHVRVLERAGLVRRRIEGRAHLCRIEAKPLAAAEEWLSFYERFWSGAFDVLDAIFNAENAAAPKVRPSNAARGAGKTRSDRRRRPRREKR